MIVPTTMNDTSGMGKVEKVVQKLVKISRPIARVSSLCIHLETMEERKSLILNKETHLTPILGTAGILMDGIKGQLTGYDDDHDHGNGRGDGDGDENEDEAADGDFWRCEQDPFLLAFLATELGVQVKDIADFELSLFDTQPACLGGIKNEFVYFARLDNQATCFVAIESLIAHTNLAPPPLQL
jgi:aspartyl aminopeptidase